MNNEQAEKLFQAKEAYHKTKKTYEALRDKAVSELTAVRKGIEKETVKVTMGRVVISVSYNDTLTCIAWERIVERVQNLFPKVSAALANIMRGTYVNEKGERVPYVKPSPRATLTIDVTE